MSCSCKQNGTIKLGDLVTLNNITGEVELATLKDSKRIYGVCADIMSDDEIIVANEGIVDVNVVGIICLGDHLTISSTDGKAEAIKVLQEEDIYDTRSIGKVVGLYDIYSKAKVLLNIK